METASHEDEPAGTGPVADEAELSAFGQWWRDKIKSAERAGVFPVDANPSAEGDAEH